LVGYSHTQFYWSALAAEKCGNPMAAPGHMQGWCRTRLISAVLFAVSILAPHLALAAGAASSHCLTNSESAHLHQDSGAAPHDHANASEHHQTDAAGPHHADTAAPESAPDPDGHVRSCCGVFCLTGLAAVPTVTITAPAGAGRVAADIDRSMDGRGPDRIIRPPKA
jgi:hypothetical protein